jgi:Domain of unknown function (DUF4282)/zinc-ribbon domain
MADIFCSKCGQQMSDAAIVCPSCGNPRAMATAPATGASLHHLAELDAAGFFKTLLDTSFKSFITLKLIKLVCMLGAIAVTISSIFFGFSGFFAHSGMFLSWDGSFWRGLLTLFIGMPFVWFVWMLWLRIVLEFLSAFFRIAENTTVLVNLLEKQ